MMAAKTDIIADVMRTEILPPATDAIPAAEIKKIQRGHRQQFYSIDLVFSVFSHTAPVLHVFYDHSLELLIHAVRATALR